MHKHNDYKLERMTPRDKTSDGTVYGEKTECDDIDSLFKSSY